MLTSRKSCARARLPNLQNAGPYREEVGYDSCYFERCPSTSRKPSRTEAFSR